MGTTIKIREWEDMEREFGLDMRGYIDCRPFFAREMRYLCGNTYKVRLNSEGRGHIDDWTISKNVYSVIAQASDKRTKIKIKEWEDMVKEFGLEKHGDINCRPFFSKEMKYLCGNVYEVELNNRGRGNIGDWLIGKDMYVMID